MQICECNSRMLEARVLELNGDEMNLGGVWNQRDGLFELQGNLLLLIPSLEAS